MPGTKRSGGLSIAAAIAFAVGNMVGAGVFVLSGLVVGVAGPSAILSYLFCGIIVAFSGISYAALASIFPEDGGGYLFARRMLGSFPGFIAGWAMYISLTIAAATPGPSRKKVFPDSPGSGYPHRRCRVLCPVHGYARPPDHSGGLHRAVCRQRTLPDGRYAAW
jgi:H+/Cl- antiporter ClcA